MLPRDTENKTGANLGAKWSWGAWGRPSEKATGRTVPIPAQLCTAGTWHGRFKCLSLALDLLV